MGRGRARKESNWGWAHEPVLRLCLRQYLEMVGAARFDAGWTPPPLPADLPDWRVPEPAAPPPNAAGD